MAQANSQSTTSRRNVLIGTAAAAILPATVVAGAVAEPDPIFAAIEAHKAAWFEFARLDNWLFDRENELSLDKPVWAKVEAEYGPERDRLWSVHQDKAFDLLDTAPATMAGVIALLDYVERVNAAEFSVPDSRAGGVGLYVSGAIEWPESVERTDLPNWNGKGPRNMDFHEALCRHVLEALRDIAPVNLAA